MEKIEILICQVDKYNEFNILATKKFSPSTIFYLYRKETEGFLNSLKEYYSKNFPQIVLKDYLILEGDVNALSNIINKNRDKNILVNLTGGNRINSLILKDLCNKSQINSIYLDIKNKKIYNFNDDINIISEDFDDLELESLIKISGGEVINESTNLSKKKNLIILTKFIYKNLDIWHKYKQKLCDSNIFNHSIDNHKELTINLILLSEEEKSLLNRILEYLKKMGEVNYNKVDNVIKVSFNNEYLKSFIFKSGTWLEIVTNNLISEIKEIDEVKSGLMFFWNDKSKRVRNEVDVVAVKDSVVICISCKDSDKYNENALNELDVYSSKIGGKNVYKILVATKEPLKASVTQRAKEMGISLVIFDGNEEKFKKKIQGIIAK